MNPGVDSVRGFVGTARTLTWLLAVAAVFWLVETVGWLEPVERRLADRRVRVAAPSVPAHPDIIVVEIDDGSLQAMQADWGRWPWSRDVIAGVIDHLAEARVVALDVLFSEQSPDESESDAALVRAVQNHGSVVAAVYRHEELTNGGTNDPLLQPFPALRDACVELGHVQFLADDDGVVRSHPLSRTWDGQTFRSLAATAVAAMDWNPSGESVGNWQIRWSRKRFPSVPISELVRSRQAILNGQEPVVAPDLFRDKLVWIGSTATGVEADRQNTSMGVYVPGVYSLATVSSNLLHGLRYRLLGPVPRALLLTGLALLLAGLARRPLNPLLTHSILLAAFVVGAWLVAPRGWLIPVAAPTGLMLTGLVGSVAARWREEQRQRAVLQELEQARQAFTDMLVHDMKNLLQPVSMNLQLLEGAVGQAADDKTERRVARAMRGVSALTERLENLLSIRCIQEDRLPLHPEACALAPTVDSVVDGLQPVAASGDQEVSIRVPADLQVWFDPELLARVLENLVVNALHHAPPGAQVTIHAEPGADHGSRLTIANPGPIISPEVLPMLFEPFVRGESTPRMAGSGLGLALARLAVEAHGGSISIASPRPDAADGVSVTVQLPPMPAVEF